MFNKTLRRSTFKEIMRFLRFDMESQKQQRAMHDKFFLVLLLLWNPFIEYSQTAFVLRFYKTIDEQLLPCKARCRFNQYRSNVPDKFGTKLLMAVDSETKYLFLISVPYERREQRYFYELAHICCDKADVTDIQTWL